MGNNCCSDEAHRHYQRDHTLNALKGRLISICEERIEIAERTLAGSLQFKQYREFMLHELPVQIILFTENASRSGIRPDPEWYKRNFDTTYQETLSFKPSASEDPLQHTPSLEPPLQHQLIQELAGNEGTIFALLLNFHLAFLERIIKDTLIRYPGSNSGSSPDRLHDFTLQNDLYHTGIDSFNNTSQQTPKSTSENMAKVRRSIITTTHFKPKHLTMIIRNAPIHVVRLLLTTIVGLFSLLNKYVMIKYSSKLADQYPNRQVELEEYHACVQGVVQNFIFSNGSIVRYLMTPLLERYYEIQEPNVSGHRTVPQLDQTLMPTVYDYSIFEISKEYHPPNSMFDASLSVSSSGGDSVLVIDRMMMVIKRSEILHTEQSIPYSQTFEILNDIAREPRYVKKCKLIERLDKLIVDLYLFQRPDEQLQQYMDVIQAEDSKLEILLFVLYKFEHTQQKYQLQRDLFNHVRFMIDFDEVLHHQIKFIHNQSYIRFYQILEMIVQYMV